MYDYGIPPDHAQGQPPASSSSPSMLPPSNSSDPRNDHLQQQQQQQQQPYPYPYDPYPPPAGPSSYDYAFQRAQIPTGMDSMTSPYGHGNGNGNTSWDSPYGNGSSSSQDRSRDQVPSWMMGEGNGIYGPMGIHDMSRNDSGPIDGQGNGHGGAGLGLGGDDDSWRRNGPGWGNDYGRPAGPSTSFEKELEDLRSHINDLVESIRPYASSPNNPRPPRPPPYAQQRFVRLAATIQSTLSTLQPYMHPLLHPEFLLTPPMTRSTTRVNLGNGHSNGGGPSSSIKQLSSAEEEMEVIRKRRDMLIARAAQVSASQQPPPAPAVNQQPAMPYSQHQQIQSSPQQPQQLNSQPLPYPYSQMHTQSQNQFQPNWTHSDMYGNGGLYTSNPLSIPTSTSGSPYNPGMALAPFDDNTNMSRRSTMDNFDPGLARFSLDPTKIAAHPEKVSKKNSPEGGKCHGCSVTVTAEWRRGPDGPRSLCNACGLHYAKLTRKRALEEAQVKMSQI